MENIKIFVPNIKLQNNIENIFIKLDMMIFSLEEELFLLKEKKSVLLHKIFNDKNMFNNGNYKLGEIANIKKGTMPKESSNRK